MKVSICLPTYKQKEFLEKTIESILAQSFTDYELIITDDTPGDEIGNFIYSVFARFDGKLKYYKNLKPLGSPENWNECISHAQGEYIKIMHHDDWFTDSDSLSHFVKMLDDNHKADFAFSAAVAVSIKLNKTWLHQPLSTQIEQLRKDPFVLFFGNFIGPPSSVIYRKKNKKLKYDKNLKWVVDFEFYIRCLVNNGCFAYTDKPLITSISGASHSVTNECEDNKDVEISEYTYLYRKILSLRPSLLLNYNFINFFKTIFSKYNIKSVHDIRDCGYKSSIPPTLRLLLLSNKLRQFIKA
jgi:glycosyltransferase involved in cell wall biosynthesis